MNNEDLVRFTARFRDILTKPRAQQLALFSRLGEELASFTSAEEWNTSFDIDSLYEAMTRLSIVRNIYRETRLRIRDHLGKLETPWHVVELGAGNGAVWRDFMTEGLPGRLTVVDPVESVHSTVSAILPDCVEYQAITDKVEDCLPLPECDVVLISLMLHHVAGRSAADKQRVGLHGPGKLEILKAVRESVASTNGIVVVNEGDVYADIDLAPGDCSLVNNFIDGYVRRFALSILDDIEERKPDEVLRNRWLTLMKKWSFEQVDQGRKPWGERDVYELDVARWMKLFNDSGFRVEQHGYLDEYLLFHQYVLRPA